MGLCLIVLVLFLRAGLLGGAAAVWSAFRPRDGAWQAGAYDAATAVTIDFDLLRRLRNDSSHTGVSLETDNATKRFGDVVPVDDVSQDFHLGRVRCVIGPNGAGKSSYLKTCIGIYKPDFGKVLLDGSDVTRTDPFARVQRGLGIKMQWAKVFGELDVRCNLWIAASSRSRDRAVADATTTDMLSMLAMTQQPIGLRASFSTASNSGWILPWCFAWRRT